MLAHEFVDGAEHESGPRGLHQLAVNVGRVVDFFCPAAEDRPAARTFRPNSQENPVAKQNLGGRLSALALNAGELLVTDLEQVTWRVVLPDDKGEIEFESRVTGPIAFLVAKLDARIQRDKPKDAYDIVWLIENWPGGPVAAAASFAQRSAFSDVTLATLQRLDEFFSDTNQVGPASYARFLSSDNPDLDRRQAVGAVSEFVVALGNLRAENNSMGRSLSISGQVELASDTSSRGPEMMSQCLSSMIC